MNDAPKKHSRLGLFAPLIVLAVLVVGWSIYWHVVAGRIENELKQQQDGLVSQGYRFEVAPYKVTGFPFRHQLTLTNLTVIAPSGRGYSFPALEAAANAYAIDKWVLVAPRGLIFHRGGDLGTLAVSGSTLRASLSHLTRPVPNIAIEGNDLSVVPSDLTKPFTFDNAKKFEAYLRANATTADNADVLIRLTGAHGQTGRFVGDFSPGKPLDMHVEATLTHARAFSGRDLATGIKAWKQSGAVNGFKSELKNGDLRVFASSDSLAFDAEGRPVGKLTADMSGTFRPLHVLAAAGLLSKENMTAAAPFLNMTLATVGDQKLTIDFRDGGAYIGPLKVSDAPVFP